MPAVVPYTVVVTIPNCLGTDCDKYVHAVKYPTEKYGDAVKYANIDIYCDSDGDGNEFIYADRHIDVYA